MRPANLLISPHHRTASIIHSAGFLLPVLLSLYALLIVLKITTPVRQVDALIAAIICLGWIALGAYQLAFVARTRRESIVRLVAYHFFAVAYILIISGFSMPFICTWAILFLAAFEFFSHKGLRLSMAALFITAVADVLINLGTQQYLLANLIALVATLAVGTVAVHISQAQQVDRKELDDARGVGERERDRALTLINNFADAVLATDKQGIIQLYNAASIGLLDTNAELAGTSIDDVISIIDDRNKRFKLSKALKSAKSVVTRDDLSATISHETIRLSVIYSPIRSANSTSSHQADGYVVILRDITKQKSLEEERDEFISVVSHELRTPITIAEGTLSNVAFMMKRDDIPRDTLASNVTVAHEQVLFLAKMVNDLSTLSRAERGVADAAEMIDVTSLINDLYTEHLPEAEAKKLKLNLSLDTQLGSVEASPLYLKELLQNFITNAIKYTKEGSVTLQVKKDKTSLIFSVSDTGIGISKSDQAHIFDKFWRSEDYRTRETGGTGLGLYVTRKLAKKLDTDIVLTSRLNYGSTFSFTLPRR